MQLKNEKKKNILHQLLFQAYVTALFHIIVYYKIIYYIKYHFMKMEINIFNNNEFYKIVFYIKYSLRQIEMCTLLFYFKYRFANVNVYFFLSIYFIK